MLHFYLIFKPFSPSGKWGNWKKWQEKKCKASLSQAWKIMYFPAIPIPIIFSNFEFNCSNLSSLRNLQEQVKKAFCYQELFWPFTVWINCSSDLKNFENSRPSASNFKSCFWSLEQFFLTVVQNNFGNKIPFPRKSTKTNVHI